MSLFGSNFAEILRGLTNRTPKREVWRFYSTEMATLPQVRPKSELTFASDFFVLHYLFTYRPFRGGFDLLEREIRSMDAVTEQQTVESQRNPNEPRSLDPGTRADCPDSSTNVFGVTGRETEAGCGQHAGPVVVRR